MGYTENISSILKWGNSFQRQFDFPLDRTSIHSSYEDAVRYARGEKGFKSGNYEADARELWKLAYIGQTITVWGLNEKGKEGVWVYSLVPAPEGSDYLADLKPVGSATTESATNYSAAKVLSQGLAVGQLIQVDEAEEIEETIEGATVKNTYQAGFYIVNAPGSISALATSSGADDEIGALETRVSALEGNKVAKADFETYQGQVTDALAGKVDNSYKQEVTDALAGKVDDGEFSDYQGQMETALAGKVDNSYKQEVTDALAGKVDNSYKQEVSTALDGKVDDGDFEAYQGQMETALAGKVDNSYKQEVTDALAGKVDNSYKQEVTDALAGKVDNSYKQEVTDAFDALESKVDTDIQNLTALTGRVDTDIQNLAAHVGDFEGYVTDVDGRLNGLETFVGEHIGHDGITIAEIESLFAQSEE